MGGVEDSQWVDKFMDGIGVAFTKIDETIQKGIELWTELTRVDDQPTQGLTGQPKSGESSDKSSSQIPVAEVKERVPIQVYLSMSSAEVKNQPSQHWVMRASTISEIIQEQSGDGDEQEEEEEFTVSEEDNESSSTLNHDYHELLKMAVDMISAKEADYDGDGEDLDTFSDEDDEDLDTFSEEDDEEEDDTTTSKSTQNMLELKLGASATSYIPSSYHHHHEEDNTDSSLKWKGNNQLLKNVYTSSEEEDDESSDDDVVWKCLPEDLGEVTEVSWKHIMMSDLSNESLRVNDNEDDVTDKLLQGFVDVRQEDEIGNNTESREVETLSPESDWVYVTRD